MEKDVDTPPLDSDKSTNDINDDNKDHVYSEINIVENEMKEDQISLESTGNDDMNEMYGEPIVIEDDGKSEDEGDVSDREDEWCQDTHVEEQDDKSEGTRLFLRPIPDNITAEDIRKLFVMKGFTVVDSYVPLNKGRSKGYGFVGFETVQETKKALELNTIELRGCTLTIASATGKEFARSDDEATSVLFVRNLPKNITIEQISKHFPNQKEVRLMNNESGNCRGIAFVEFPSVRDAKIGKSEAKNLVIEGRQIGVEFAQPKKNKNFYDQRNRFRNRSDKSQYERPDYRNYRSPPRRRISRQFSPERDYRRRRDVDDFRGYFPIPPPVYDYDYPPIRDHRPPPMMNMPPHIRNIPQRSNMATAQRGHANPRYYRNTPYPRYDDRPEYPYHHPR